MTETCKPPQVAFGYGLYHSKKKQNQYVISKARPDSIMTGYRGYGGGGGRDDEMLI